MIPQDICRTLGFLSRASPPAPLLHPGINGSAAAFCQLILESPFSGNDTNAKPLM